jgi:hypothetical protein
MTDSIFDEPFDSFDSFDSFDGLADSLDWSGEDRQLEKADRIAARTLLRRAVKREYKFESKIESAAELAFMPRKGETIHVISSGYFDHWSLIPVYCGLLGGQGLTFYGTTWTMNRENALDLIRLYDQGIVSTISMFTGTYFKRRSTAVYSVLVNGLMSRKGCAFTAFKNHTKITLLDNGDDTIIIEGSANYTENQNAENYTVSNDRSLFDFHRQWMDEIAHAEANKKEAAPSLNRRRFKPGQAGPRS